ncbi:TetR/AcrR family transcriptional regulator [Pantoea sp. Tr-811]|uniref:TetR/AcrR family transcriptional regulator n=1 Tax=Pantoea sp. Tr-811 TaxID=2608361 RepID=UPI001421C37C|nr:TetR/AcrR family transcriptional regulator [Pantoea sp. Tr-811]NIF24954.1 TetR/AcrR family transcriptional regulator [Pantoea sp. Tr-811]
MPASSRTLAAPMDAPRVAPPDARDRLLDAASMLFARHGYQAISLRDLANHLGLRAGSLYHHIDSKQGLLYELIESTLTDLLYETRTQLRRQATSEQRLSAFVEVFVAYSQGAPERLTLVTREAVNLSEEQAEHIDELKRAYRSLLSGIVAADCGAQLTGPHPWANDVADAILSLLSGHTLWGMASRRWEQAAPMLLRFIRGILESAPLHGRAHGA